MKLFQDIQMVDQPVDLSLKLGTYFSDKTKEALLERINTDLNHLRVGKVYHHSWKTYDEISHSLRYYFRPHCLLQFLVV